MKPLVIYHANCADGFGAAFAAWLKFGDEAEYLPMRYLKDKDKTAAELCAEFDKYVSEWRGRELYIVDFSLPKPVMNMIFALSKKVIWLDHHKTAFEMWCEDGERQFFEWAFMNEPENDSYIKLDNSKSGAMIAWEYFHPATEVPMLIKHIDDYDRWQFKIEGTKEFNKALWSYAPWSFEQWKEKFFYQIGFSAEDGVREKPLIDMKMEGAAILRAHDANVKAVVKSVARKCMLQYKVNDTSGSWHDATYTKEGLAANCPPHLSSDVGHQLANQSGTYGLLWFINKEGKCLCSLRSNSDYDVSAIAKTFGGGGHKNAAGFEVDIQTLLEWIK